LHVAPAPRHAQPQHTRAHHRLNKYILAAELGGFPFPLALTTAHMAFCAALSWLLVRARLVAVQDMPIETYLRCVRRVC
jgi:hypothetical protein